MPSLALKQLTLDALQLVALNGPREVDSGICWAVEDKVFDIDPEVSLTAVGRVLCEAFKKWPKFSGNPAFPIPTGEENVSSMYYRLDNLWDMDTQYGRDRWELLKFCIEQLEAEIGIEETVA